MESEQADIHQYDREEIIDGVTDLFQRRVDWMGFRTRSEVAGRFDDGGVVWTHRDGDIACAASYRHRETSHTRVYFTAMAEPHWDAEMWESMVKRILESSPHNRLITKTPVDCEEGELWEQVGHWVRREAGKNRALDVWEVVNYDFSGIETW